MNIIENKSIELQGKITITIPIAELVGYLQSSMATIQVTPTTPSVIHASDMLSYNQPQGNPASRRIRTIPECLRMLKSADPKTEVTYFFIKQLAVNNKVKHLMSGNKIMINYDHLLEVLLLV